MSPIEKRDKLFNWQRPTTSTLNCRTLQLNCFPGVEYVQHYAAITATYFSLKGRNPESVQYALPSQQECLEPLLSTNLAEMGGVDIVIVGYVHGLEHWTQGPWEGSNSNKLFSWKKIMTPRGYRAAFLGCRVSFWGDIAGNIVRAFQELNGEKCVLYVGKSGGLRSEHVPNHWPATGCQSVVHSELVIWANPLESHLQHSSRVAYGVHCTLGLVLDETKEWLLAARRQYDFVDPEIGHMAKASLEGGTEFGYLHIISRNLVRKYTHDLSNERLTDVIHVGSDWFRRSRTS